MTFFRATRIRVATRDGTQAHGYGSKGVGEIGLVPTAGAVAAALFAHDGIRRTSLPMADSPAAQASLPPSRKAKT